MFAGELGARLDGPEPGLDIDAFDAYCDHLLVARGRDRRGRRHLPAAAARSAPGSPAASTPRPSSTSPGSPPSATTSSRSAAPASTPTHRNGAVIALIWAGLARYMTRTGHNWLAGCCSIPLADGGTLAAATWDTVKAKNLAPEEYWVTPHQLWNPDAVARPDGRTELPALLRGYLRLGAWVCGAPAHDPDFGCRRPLRPALAAPHQPALPAPLPLPRPGAMSVWLPTAPCTPRGCAGHHGPAAGRERARARLLAGSPRSSLVLLGVLVRRAARGCCSDPAPRPADPLLGACGGTRLRRTRTDHRRGRTPAPAGGPSSSPTTSPGWTYR